MYLILCKTIIDISANKISRLIKLVQSSGEFKEGAEEPRPPHWPSIQVNKFVRF